MRNIKEITYEEWDEKYRPLKDSYGEVIHFQPVGEDLEFLDSQDKHCIWTYLAGDDWEQIESGIRFVNRIGYIVTEIPFKKEEWHSILIILEQESDD